MAPGQMALMRTPLCAFSSAAVLVRPSTPCFDAQYGDRPGEAITPAPDEVLTMAPPPCSTMCAISCFMHRNTPVRLTAITRSNSRSDIACSAPPLPAMPALLWAQSSRPKVETVCATRFSTSRSRDTSA